MNRFISKTMRISAVAATVLLGTVDARAQAAYTGDTGHYLQAPQGAQQTALAATIRTLFNGQGMGRGQMQTSYNGQAAQPMQPVTMMTAPSSRMLPQDASTPSTMLMQQAVPVAQPMMQPTVQLQPMTQPQPMRFQAASVPSAQTLAAMEPAAGSSFDSSSNIGLSSGCSTPGNHRQAKGINTSTTVGNSCFD